jgi:hypothetical protein
MNKKLRLMAFVGVFTIFLMGTFNVPTMATVSTTSTSNKTDALPSTINFCGVFPISKRPDAGPDRRDAFLMAVD